jgi:hypothetical protein
MTRFTCEFENHETGEQRSIEVDLPRDELERAGDNELHAQALVLRRAYRIAPRGFAHVPGGIERRYQQ